ncbi:hypothetical protein [Lichenicoccus sp.]|uniref:hypothetical protein n=1 Tax=Lichenicoccus sp. TaxID=2781899 RepID=UPI003D0BEB80
MVALAPALAPALALASALTLDGCGGRDTVDTPVNWWHQLQGGEIAKQRPPPPGVNDPYPHVGTVPAKAPVFASAALRETVTASLLRQRNLTTRVDANDPLPPPVLPAHPAKPAAGAPPAPAAPGSSSATLDAAQAAPAATAGGKAPASAAANAPGAAAAAADTDPEIAMPAVDVPAAAADAGSGTVTLPAIPGGPPASPRLPGLQVEEAAARASASAPAMLPDYQVAPPTGTQIAFVGNTDVVQSGETGLVHAIAVRRGAGTVMVHGYGDAASSEPDAQADALSLATLRGRAVADMLRAQGVPARAIRLQADAFGRGASLTLVQ